MAHKSKDIFTLLREKIAPGRHKIYIQLMKARDDWRWRQLYHDKKRQWTVKSQKLDVDKHIELGSDLATAQFVIGVCGGKILDDRGVWIERKKDLPPAYMKSFKLIAIDASRTNLMTEGTDNFADLQHLRSLDLSRSHNLDDFSCDQISRRFMKSKTLETIDLSYNERISINGLNVLFRIPTLKCIRAINSGATRHQDIDLFTLAAEEERGCQVFVHENGRQFLLDELEELRFSHEIPRLESGLPGK